MSRERAFKKCNFKSCREGSMRTENLVIVVMMAVVFLGINRAMTIQESYKLWNAIDKVERENTVLREEFGRLQLEESMLVTEALLDQETREQLRMVVPDESAVVYVIETNTDIQYVGLDKKINAQ